MVEVDQFHPKSSAHRPRTRCKVMHDGQNLYLAFRVEDRYVRCVHEAYQSPVSEDSCVEFFAEPVAGRGYFNFEFNCGGAMLLYYIEDPSAAADGPFRRYRPVPAEVGRQVRVIASLPQRVEPEITRAVTWELRCVIPAGLFPPFVGELGPLGGQCWRVNFFKCGDRTSHPHWASWSPIGERLRFHQPDRFAPMRFE